MSVQALIGGREYQIEDYEVSEDSTPLSGGDSTGSVGTITLTLHSHDSDLEDETGFALFRAEELIEQDVTLTDTRRGYTVGQVTGVDYNRGSALYTVDCRTRLGDLISYNVQTQPFAGTLEGAVQYYLSLSGVSEGFLVDPAIATRQVLVPGWFGDVWQHLKMFAVSQEMDITFVSGVILFRPIRQREAINGRDDSRAFSRPSTNPAQFVEVFQYNNRYIENAVVYPVPGEENTEVFTVERGRSAYFDIPLSASLLSVNPPNDNFLGSTYRILTDEGVEVPRDVWLKAGGSVKAEINSDTTSLTLTVVAPDSVPLENAYQITSFSLAKSGADGNPVPALQLTGSGVAFLKESVMISTGVGPDKTATEVGTTIDNPFLSSTDEVYRAGVSAARAMSGPQASLGGTLVAINRVDDSGSVALVTYGDVQEDLETGLGAPSYGSVKTHYGGLGLNSYRDVQDYWVDRYEDDDITQVFGNVQGTRVFDKRSRRWYRIRSANITPEGIRYDADDDLTWADMLSGPLSGVTYSEAQSRYNGMTYSKVERIGMYYG